eukprot:superscaffoldBa00003080_g16055
MRHGRREAESCGSGPGVATGHWDSTAKRQPGDDRMGTVTMETQAAQANHGNCHMKKSEIKRLAFSLPTVMTLPFGRMGWWRGGQTHKAYPDPCDPAAGYH